jgi:very-short-patch-repair endonuclease
MHKRLEKFKKLEIQWHPTKNGNQIPSDFSAGSNKKVWWQCTLDPSHEWQASVADRTALVNFDQCPLCKNDLAIKHPKLVNEWHPTKNGNQIPSDFSAGSSKKVWWQCPEGDDHEWPTAISNRTIGKSGCPFCAGKKADQKNNLASLHPALAKEWHFGKNGNLIPEAVLPGTQRKVWWQCPRSREHVWKAVILNRVYGSGCPFCKSQTSKAEIRIFSEMQEIFKGQRVLWRSKLSKMEMDVYIPHLKVAIEYDGAYWHSGRKNKDLKKNITLSKKGVQVLRVREYPLERLSAHDVKIGVDSVEKGDIDRVLSSILDLSNNRRDILDSYTATNEFMNDEGYRRIISFLPAPPPEKSLLKVYPNIAKTWDYQGNYPLRPEYFSPNSGAEVQWICEQDKTHKWKVKITHRVSKAQTHCPFCSNKRVNSSNSLQAVRPDIAKQWHPEKNEGKDPSDVVYGSNVRVWWQCPEGNDHEWEAQISERTRATKATGCPFCSGARLSKSRTLESVNPEIAAEWHFLKNSPTTPSDVSSRSDNKYWWQCKYIESHEWEAAVISRIKGSQCPQCRRERR